MHMEQISSKMKDKIGFLETNKSCFSWSIFAHYTRISNIISATLDFDVHFDLQMLLAPLFSSPNLQIHSLLSYISDVSHQTLGLLDVERQWNGDVVRI